MKVSAKNRHKERQILDSKISRLQTIPAPRIGWLKAVRTALGLSAKQLGERVGSTPQVITRMEEREIKGNVSLASLEEAANAMNCRLVYAIVPEEQFATFDAIVNERAKLAAWNLAAKVHHSMKLEDQAVDKLKLEEQITSLAKDLKDQLDPSLWAKKSE